MRIFRTIKQNWAKTSCCTPSNIDFPKTQTQLIELVKEANKNQTKLKIVGGGHSYNDIFCPDNGILISLKKMSKVEYIDKSKKPEYKEYFTQIDKILLK